MRKKLVLPIETAMTCKLKTHQHRETCGGSDNQKKQSMHASQKPTNLREQVQLVKSLQLGAQVHSYVPSVDRDLEELEKLPAWQLSKVKSKREVIQEAKKSK